MGGNGGHTTGIIISHGTSKRIVRPSGRCGMGTTMTLRCSFVGTPHGSWTRHLSPHSRFGVAIDKDHCESFDVVIVEEEEVIVEEEEKVCHVRSVPIDLGKMQQPRGYPHNRETASWRNTGPVIWRDEETCEM